MTLLHLGIVVYDLICVILMSLGVLGEEKEFRAKWRKIEPSYKNRSMLPLGVRTPGPGNNSPTFYLLASERQGL